MLVRHSFANPPPFEVDYAKRNEGPDRGLVNAWLSGIAMRKDKPTLAQQAAAGELPVLAFRGGVTKSLASPALGAVATGASEACVVAAVGAAEGVGPTQAVIADTASTAIASLGPPMGRFMTSPFFDESLAISSFF